MVRVKTVWKYGSAKVYEASDVAFESVCDGNYSAS